MNLSNLGKRIVQRCSLLLVVLSMTAVASAGRSPQKSEPAHKSAPSKPASHAAPAHHSGGHASSSGHKATGEHAASRTQAPAGGHTANTGHSPMGGHPSTSGHAPVGGRNTMTGRTPSGGHSATAPRSPVRAFTPPARNAPAGTRNVSLKGGGAASLRSNGQIRSIDHNGMHIDHGVNGGRTVVSEHNGVRVVNTGRNSGYVQRSYMTSGGHSYYSRTYYSNNSYHTSVYRSYYWGGHAYYGWHPGYWYHPGFYAWGYHPWGFHVSWGLGLWGWGGSPWWGFYGGWFTPYPYYAAPAYWLTDYLIAAELQSAYAARQEAYADAAAANYGSESAAPAAAPASSTVTLSPEVKEAIADEVKAELAAQQAQAPQTAGSDAQAAPAPANSQASAPASAPANGNEEVPPALDPARRTFVVASALTVTANGQECGLTAGDVLTRLTDTPDANNMVNASVSASKGSDCAAGQTVSVKVDDLQEMRNHFEEQLNNGMGELAKKQGTDGMPKAPDTNVVESDIPPPQPDKTAEKTLQDQQQAADQTETQVKQEAAAPAAPAPSAPPDAQQ